LVKAYQNFLLRLAYKGISSYSGGYDHRGGLI